MIIDGTYTKIVQYILERSTKLSCRQKKIPLNFFYFLDHFGNLNLPTMLTEVMTCSQEWFIVDG